MEARHQNGRRVTRTKRSAEFTILQIRISSASSPDLFDFVMGLPEGTASGYGRNVLDQALRSGHLTPSGFTLNDDDRMVALRMQLQIAKEDLIAANEQIAILNERVSRLQQGGIASTAMPATSKSDESGVDTTAHAPSSVNETTPPLAPAPQPQVPLEKDAPALEPASPKAHLVENRPPQAGRVLPMGFASALRSNQGD